MIKQTKKSKPSCFYGNLRAEMARKGLSVAETAKHLGVSRQSFYLRLSGNVKFTLEEAQKLAALFDVDVDYLMKLKVKEGE